MRTHVDGVASALTFGVSDSLKEASQMLSAVMQQGLLALLAGGGVNPLGGFSAARQRDLPREEWFWADVLHYWRSGRFVENLVRGAKLTGNPNHLAYAYAYGYATHYVTDVVGHPFVNRVVGAPWRLYWQRHHLVENFVDAYVWDRWHTPTAAVPGAGEPPLDRVSNTPNSTIGSGAPLSYARLHDHVDIGAAMGRDPVDDVVDAVTARLARCSGISVSR